MARSIWDKPVTDEELNAFYGEDYKPAPHDAACNAIRSIHFVDFEQKTAQSILAVLIEKMRACQYTKDSTEAIEAMELAFGLLDK